MRKKERVTMRESGICAEKNKKMAEVIQGIYREIFRCQNQQEKQSFQLCLSSTKK